MSNRIHEQEDGIDYSGFYAIVKEVNLYDYLAETSNSPSDESMNFFAPSWLIKSADIRDTRSYVLLAHMVKKGITRVMNQEAVKKINEGNMDLLYERLMPWLEKGWALIEIVELTRVKLEESGVFEWRIKPRELIVS